MEQGGAFATPKLNIPAGSVVKMFVKKISKDVLLEINDTTIKITNSIKNITDTIRNNCDNITITNKSTYSIYIDSITITTPRDVLSSENYVLSNDTLRIHNLSPATKYYVEICDTITDETRQYSFETKRQIEHLTSRIQSSNTVKLSLTNNGTRIVFFCHNLPLLPSTAKYCRKNLLQNCGIVYYIRFRMSSQARRTRLFCHPE